METIKKSSKLIFRIILLLICMLGVFMWFRSHQAEKVNKTQTETAVKNPEATLVTGPPTIIYKTKADYFKLVPVGISQDKKSIVSYPNMTDVLPNNYPIKLNKGYLFGNVSVNSGFLKLTMEEYSVLKELPSPEKLYDLLMDDDPFLEMYDCGSRSEFKELEKELNQVIDDGDLASRCNKLR